MRARWIAALVVAAGLLGLPAAAMAGGWATVSLNSTPDDLGPESREQLQTLTGRGVPMDRAVQMLLIQERYRSALEELRQSQATHLLEPTP